MQEKILRNIGLQDKSLVERIVIRSVTKEILSYTQIDGKMGMTISARRERPAENCSRKGGR